MQLVFVSHWNAKKVRNFYVEYSTTGFHSGLWKYSVHTRNFQTGEFWCEHLNLICTFAVWNISIYFLFNCRLFMVDFLILWCFDKLMARKIIILKGTEIAFWLTNCKIISVCLKINSSLINSFRNSFYVMYEMNAQNL